MNSRVMKMTFAVMERENVWSFNKMRNTWEVGENGNRRKGILCKAGQSAEVLLLWRRKLL